jgi:hypothetical protein
MASIMGLPIQDYRYYTTSYALHQLYIDWSQLFKKLVNYIANSLGDNYYLSLGSFPSSQSQENAYQREERNTIIQEWLGELD